MKTTIRCKSQILLERAAVRLEFCDCEVFHLSIGPITIHLLPQAFESLRAALIASEPQPTEQAALQ